VSERRELKLNHHVVVEAEGGNEYLRMVTEWGNTKGFVLCLMRGWEDEDLAVFAQDRTGSAFSSAWAEPNGTLELRWSDGMSLSVPVDGSKFEPWQVSLRPGETVICLADGKLTVW